MGKKEKNRSVGRAILMETRERMLVSAVAVALVMGVFFVTPGSGAAFRNLKVGQPAPDFTVKDMEDTDRNLSAQKGNVVILSFVKVDQDRSIKTLNALEEVNGIFKSDGVTVWGITSQTEDRGAIEGLMEKLALNYPILLDEGQKLYGEFGLFTFPSTMVVDQKGNYVHEYSSYSSDFQDTIVNDIKVLLGLISEEDSTSAAKKTEIVKQSPQEVEAERNLQMAKVLLKRGFGTKALPKLEKALELNPVLVEARLLAGEVYLKDEQYDNARQQFEKVFETDSNSNEARVGIASVYIAEGKLDEAEAHLQKAITLNPDPSLALYRLGQVYEKKGDTQQAMETYRNALERLLKKKGK
jgi:tetratricopeptide (TPR) repeat protein